ncbi:MAG TPA: hypothetical protein VGJ88_00440 [Thermoanaerobaculia bacterium]|jgi:hypothetical protein
MPDAISGSAREIKDFSSFCEGDIDPTLNKRIRVLIDADTQYIVYLDEELYVEWSMAADFPLQQEFGDIANTVGHLETLSLGRLRPNQRLPFERLLGEAMARLIGDEDPAKAREVLVHASNYLNTRSVENARSWHIGTAAIATTITSVLLAIVVFFTSDFRPIFGEATTTLVTAALVGPLGALLSILSRVRDLDVNPRSGSFIHRFEGVCRIVAGFLGSLLIALGVRSDLIFGFVNKQAHAFAALLVVCFVAGASERIVPSFISQIEGRSTGGKNRDRRGRHAGSTGHLTSELES